MKENYKPRVVSQPSGWSKLSEGETFYNIPLVEWVRLERIFEKTAKETMVRFNMQTFKKTNKRLLRAIIVSMSVYAGLVKLESKI